MNYVFLTSNSISVYFVLKNTFWKKKSTRLKSRKKKEVKITSKKILMNHIEVK